MEEWREVEKRTKEICVENCHGRKEEILKHLMERRAKSSKGIFYIRKG